jgi:hypothetical protein
MPVVLKTMTEWVCPNCTMTDATYETRPHSQMHSCPGLHGILAPFVRAGVKCKVEAHQREDYIGGEIVRTDDRGRPIMSVTTTREDGEDVMVFAPTASARIT